MAHTFSNCIIPSATSLALPNSATYRSTLSTMAATMDPIQLLYRNAQLETELRLVNEQLAQAHNANQYLLGRLSQSANGTQAANSNQPHQVPPTSDVGSNDPNTSSLSPADRAEKRKDSLIDFDGDTEENGETDELIRFEEDREALSWSKKPEQRRNRDPSKVKHEAESITPRQPLSKASVGLGISNAYPCYPSQYPRTSRDGAPFRIYQSDGTSYDLPIPASGNKNGSTHLTSSPAPRPFPFQDGVHNALLGRACFLEDETKEERAEHWNEYAKRDERHTAKEYEAYYEHVIRPLYLAKMQEREQAANKSVKNAPQPKEEPATENLLEFDPQQNVEETSSTADTVVGDLKHGSEPHAEEVAPTLNITPDPAAGDKRSVAYDINASSSAAPEVHTVQEVVCRNEDASSTEAMAPSSTTTSTDISTPGVHTPVMTPSANLGAAKAFQQQLRIGELRHHAFPRRSSPRTPRYVYDSPPQNCPFSTADLLGKPAEGDRHPCRTVLITNIPSTTTLHSVLSNIKNAGKIFSATYLDTAGMRTTPKVETNTVLLTFVSGKRAENFAKRHNTEEETIFLSSSTESIPYKANVTLLHTPTRPIPAYILRQVRENNLSRVLFVHDHLQRWDLDQVEYELLRGGARKPFHISYDAEVTGLMVFEFASLAEGKKAWEVVQRDYGFFQGVGHGFYGDPCEGKVGKGEGEKGDANVAEDGDVGSDEIDGYPDGGDSN